MHPLILLVSLIHYCMNILLLCCGNDSYFMHWTLQNHRNICLFAFGRLCLQISIYAHVNLFIFRWSNFKLLNTNVYIMLGIWLDSSWRTVLDFWSNDCVICFGLLMPPVRCCIARAHKPIIVFLSPSLTSLQFSFSWIRFIDNKVLKQFYQEVQYNVFLSHFFCPHSLI